MERLYTIPEAAKALSVTRQTIYNWSKAGIIKFVRVNGRPRITETQIKSIVMEDE